MGFFDDTSADVKAINDYFKRTAPKTAAAAQLKKSWETWYSGLNFVTLTLDSTFQEATNRRNAFDVAQAKNPEELAKTKAFIASATENDKKIRPDLYKPTDAAGNFSNNKGITVASAASGTVTKGSRPTIRQGSRGDAVKEWQKIIGVNDDGIFGSGTFAATKAWQKERGLTPDGVVGPASWGAALGGANAPGMSFEQAAVTPVAPANIAATHVPTGVVAQISSVKKPVPTKKPITPQKKVTPKAAAVAAKPAIQVEPPKVLTAGFSLESFKNLSTTGKAVVGITMAGIAGLAVYLHKKEY